MGQIFKGQDWTDVLSQNFGWHYHYSLRNNPEERSSPIINFFAHCVHTIVLNYLNMRLWYFTQCDYYILRFSVMDVD